MKFKFRCRGCGGELNNKEKNFPITLRNKIKDVAGKMIDTIVGYLCKKCSRKVMAKKMQQQQRKGVFA